MEKATYGLMCLRFLLLVRMDEGRNYIQRLDESRTYQNFTVVMKQCMRYMGKVDL
jgi:hypothetical protein